VRFVEKLLILLSGEHETLPVAEIKAIAEGENLRIRDIRVLDQVCILTGDDGLGDAIARRAAYVKTICKYLFSCNTNLHEIYDSVKSLNFSEIFCEKSSFAVRIHRIKNYSPDISAYELQRRIGAIILEAFGKRGIMVNLRSPDVIFIGFLTAGRFVFGIVEKVIERISFKRRAPQFRPYAHPSSMNPFLSRCMVNLSRATSGDVFYDPFCGVGGFLIEAALIGCRVLGSDIDPKMVLGSRKNLEFYDLPYLDVFLCDARSFSTIGRVDAIATDPPYGAASSTKGEDPEKLTRMFLENSESVIKRGGYVVVATPHKFDIGGLLKSTNLKLLEIHSVKVHQNLTRRILVLKRD